MDSSLKSPKKKQTIKIQASSIKVPPIIKIRNQSSMNTNHPGRNDNHLKLKVNEAANWRRRNTSSGENIRFMYGNSQQAHQLQDGGSGSKIYQTYENDDKGRNERQEKSSLQQPFGSSNGTSVTGSPSPKISPLKVKFSENPVNKTSESK